MIIHNNGANMTVEEAYKKGQMDAVDLMTRLIKNLRLETEVGGNKMRNEFLESIKNIPENERTALEEAWKDGSLDTMKGLSKTMALDTVIRKE